MKPTFKAPGSKRLKLKYDQLLSSFAFKIKLRRYNKAQRTPAWCDRVLWKTAEVRLNPNP
jgi:hypothetical protein